MDSPADRAPSGWRAGHLKSIASPTLDARGVDAAAAEMGSAGFGKAPRAFLVELMMKFIDFEACPAEGAFARGSDGVDPAPAAGHVFRLRPQQAAALHSVQEWVKGSGANSVTMMVEFFHHREAEDRFVKGVHEDVDADEAGKQAAMLHLRGQTVRPCP